MEAKAQKGKIILQVILAVIVFSIFIKLELALFSRQYAG